MKIEIEISEEDAACLWRDHFHGLPGKTVKEIVADLVADQAGEFKKRFPDLAAITLEQFRNSPSAER